MYRPILEKSPRWLYGNSEHLWEMQESLALLLDAFGCSQTRPPNTSRHPEFSPDAVPAKDAEADLRFTCWY